MPRRSRRKNHSKPDQRLGVLSLVIVAKELYGLVSGVANNPGPLLVTVLLLILLWGWWESGR
jgi:hypothetical protein